MPVFDGNGVGNRDGERAFGVGMLEGLQKGNGCKK